MSLRESEAYSHEVRRKVARRRRFTQAQRDLMDTWQSQTSIEFMDPAEGETFKDAVARNLRYVVDIAAAADRLARTVK